MYSKLIELCLIEINKLKTFERIKTRKDKNINTFMSWIYMSALINNINVNE